MEEKKKEFEDLISVELQEWYRLGLHDGFRIDDDMLLSHKEMVEGVIKKQPSTEIWDFIEKLVEEVEREQFGKARLIGEPFRKTEEDDEHGSYGTSFEN